MVVVMVVNRDCLFIIDPRFLCHKETALLSKADGRLLSALCLRSFILLKVRESSHQLAGP
jgi:hypothetical protein